MSESAPSPATVSGRGAALEAVASCIDSFTEWMGRAVAWLTLATAIICFATVYLRYVLHVGEIWLQELYTWTHVLAIMLGAGYVLMKGGFVRVDLLHDRLGSRGRAWVELLGTVFLMTPFLVMMAIAGWSFFHTSYVMNERSQWETGLPMLWLLKGTLLFFVATVGLQGIAMALRAFTFLFYHSPAPASAPMGPELP